MDIQFYIDNLQSLAIILICIYLFYMEDIEKFIRNRKKK